MTAYENSKFTTDVAPRVVLPLLPVLDAPSPRSAFTVVLPAVMLAGTVGFLVIGGGGTTSLLMGGLMAVSLVATLVSGGGRQTKPAAAVSAERDRFLRQLHRARVAVATHESALRVAAHRRHPGPMVARGGVATIGGSTPALTARVGVGAVPAVVGYEIPEDDGDSEPEPFAVVARRWFVTARATTASMPLTVDLSHDQPLLLRGCEAMDVARGIVLQCVRADCRIVLLAPDTAAGWDWLKWLPHHGADGRHGAPLRTDDVRQAARWAGVDDAATGTHPSIVLLVTVAQTRGSRKYLQENLSRCAGGVLIVDAVVDEEPGTGGIDPAEGRMLWCEGSVLSQVLPGHRTYWGAADLVGPTAATAAARRIASRRAGATIRFEPESYVETVDLAELLGMRDPRDVREARRTDRSTSDRLRIPIGLDGDGTPVQLDLKEAAQGGVGPHGLVIGATGSGKSELLRSLVLALSATHTAAALNFVLIDFKGGAGFLALQRLPHVAAVITNLADQAMLVERMRDALAGELNRRQDILRRAGLPSVLDYERARGRVPDLPPLPALVVICDEFTELLVQQPDLAELFVMLGRLGRSLGVHLLMASQRLEEGRMRGLDAHLSFRIALKTFSAADSRAVLDTDAAYRLPSTPGAGYLRTGPAEPRRFTAAYVSGPVTTAPPVAVTTPTSAGVRLFTALPIRVPEPTTATPLPAAEPTSDQPSLADLWVRQLRGSEPAAHPIWLPPLDASPTLDELPATLRPPGDRCAPRVPIGIVDRPFDQRRDLLWADFTGSGGHGLVVGGLRSGKSTLIAALVLSLARRLTPTEMHCYLVDLGGGTLAPLAALPQVGGVVRRDEPQRVRRLLAQLVAELATRERACSAHVDHPAEPRPEIFLVIDGWAGFRAAFDELEAAVATLVTRGLAYGIHVVLATSRWADVRPALKDLMGLRLELRLGDPSESEVDRRLAAAVPRRAPGRGLTSDGFHFLAATPGPRDDPHALVGLAEGVRRASPDTAAPPIRVLPALVSAGELPVVPDRGAHAVPIGLGESELGTVVADFDTDPHLVVWGDAGCGKTSFLLGLVRALAGRCAPTETRFLVVDHRRTLAGRLPEAHVAGHATSAAATAGLMTQAVTLLTGRLPGGDVRADQLAGRGWWTGPELYVLVDDYELVAAGSANPVLPLLDLLPHARDIGLHVVVCRRAAGGGRALYDPILQQLRELGSPGLVLSGPVDEGVLHGSQRALPQPPGRGFWVTRAGTELIQLAVPGG